MEEDDIIGLSKNRFKMGCIAVLIKIIVDFFAF